VGGCVVFFVDDGYVGGVVYDVDVGWGDDYYGCVVYVYVYDCFVVDDCGVVGVWWGSGGCWGEYSGCG